MKRAMVNRRCRLSGSRPGQRVNWRRGGCERCWDRRFVANSVRIIAVTTTWLSTCTTPRGFRFRTAPFFRRMTLICLDLYAGMATRPVNSVCHAKGLCFYEIRLVKQCPHQEICFANLTSSFLYH